MFVANTRSVTIYLVYGSCWTLSALHERYTCVQIHLSRSRVRERDRGSEREKDGKVESDNEPMSAVVIHSNNWIRLLSIYSSELECKQAQHSEQLIFISF